MRLEKESPSRPPAGKCEHIPGDGRRIWIDGRTYKVRSFETFVKTLAVRDHLKTIEEDERFDVTLEEMQG